MAKDRNFKPQSQAIMKWPQRQDIMRANGVCQWGVPMGSDTNAAYLRKSPYVLIASQA